MPACVQHGDCAQSRNPSRARTSSRNR
jgi:hypothetical protein